MTNLAKRLAFALVAIPIIGATIWNGGFVLAILVSAAAGFASWEFYKLAIGTGSEPLWGHGVIISMLIPIGVWARYQGIWMPPVSVVMLVVLELLAVALWVRGSQGKPLEVVGITLLGMFYTGGMLAFGFALRYHRFAMAPAAGALLVFLPLLLTWGTDTAAMLAGIQWGKTKLMPSISPNKTVVGAMGGLGVSVVVAMLFVRFVLQPYAGLSMTMAAAALFGLLVSAAGQVGDLVESMLKRQAGVKDSSALIPGHGGALDRIDSLLFTLPVSYVLYELLLIPAP